MVQELSLFNRFDSTIERGWCDVTPPDLAFTAQDAVASNVFLQKFRQLKQNPDAQKVVLDIWHNGLVELKKAKDKDWVDVVLRFTYAKSNGGTIANASSLLPKTSLLGSTAQLANLVGKGVVKVHPAVGIIAVTVAAIAARAFWQRRNTTIDRDHDINAIERMISDLKTEASR
jgi:hypothetical protein